MMPWRSIRPSPHFRLGELLVSADHPELAVGAPTEEQVAAMVLLVVGVLEPIRMRFGPVVVTSGWRPPALNAAAGGEPDSQHLDGAACDFHVRQGGQRIDMWPVFRALEALDYEWPVRAGGARVDAIPRESWLVSQAILYGPRGGPASRIHVAVIDQAHPGKGTAWQWAAKRDGEPGYQPIERYRLADGTWRL